MSIKINVPYGQKERAKSSGANWNPKERTWYIPTEIKDLSPFLEWLELADYYLIPVHSFILEGTNRCWNCKEITNVVTLGSATYRILSTDHLLAYSNKFVAFDYIQKIDEGLLEKMKSICPDYKFAFSKTVKSKYWMNHCRHCKRPIGDFFLFNEMSGPFFDPLYSLKKEYLKVHKIQTPFDCPIESGIGTHLGKEKTNAFLELTE